MAIRAAIIALRDLRGSQSRHAPARRKILPITICLLLLMQAGGQMAVAGPETAKPRVEAASDVRRACSPGDWSPPARTGAGGVQQLLKDLPPTTRWADLPHATKQKLRELAEDRLLVFRSEWDAAALEAKVKILLECPTPEMTSAIDEYYRSTYDSIVPKSFSHQQVKSAALRKALTQVYLGAYATGRASLAYGGGGLPDRDWDGKSRFNSILLPDRQAYEDWKVYFAGIRDALMNSPDAFENETERALHQQLQFAARAGAQGALFRDSFGGSDMETACQLVSWDAQILATYTQKVRPTMFASDDEVLREANAAYLHNTTLKWVDRGTTDAALNNPLCNSTTDQRIEASIGPIEGHDVAKGLKLLKAWWIERLKESRDATKACTIYSDADRRSIWEAFSADQNFNNDQSATMATYAAQVTQFSQDKQRRYRDVARLAVASLFVDDSVLTPSQRAYVVGKIDKETAFGLMSQKVADFLDAAQGTRLGPASTMWSQAIQRSVERLGGNYQATDPVRPGDEATVRLMFDKVKAWISSRYRGYPVDVAAVLPLIEFTVTTRNNATTNSGTGHIQFGIGTERSHMEFYSILILDVRHGVAGAWRANAPDKTSVASDEGAAIEGSGVAAEDLLIETFMREILKDDLAAALYTLDYGIRDARFAGTTDATLRKFFRADCSAPGAPDTIEFTKAIANEYGLTGLLATNLSVRAHAGSQYLQYISGGLQMLGDIDFLRRQMDPASKVQLDPFVLFACNLNTPARIPDYVSRLRACVGNRT